MQFCTNIMKLVLRCNAGGRIVCHTCNTDDIQLIANSSSEVLQLLLNVQLLFFIYLFVNLCLVCLRIVINCKVIHLAE